MNPGKLVLFILSAALYALVAAFAGGLMAMAADFPAEGGALLLGGASLLTSAARLVAPGAFRVAAFLLPPAAGYGGVQVKSPNRALYDAIVQDNFDMGFEDIIPIAGYIRAENVLGAGVNNIPFEINANQQVVGQATVASENRLQVNDAFYPTHYSVMFQSFVTATAGARAAARLHTFPNLDIFGLNTPSISTAYNGNLSMRVNDTVYMDSLDMWRFCNASVAQEGMAISSVATTGVMDMSAWSQNDAFAHCIDPLVRLNGQFRNQFNVKLPNSVSFLLEAANTVVAVLYLRGWLMQNGGGTRSPRPGGPYDPNRGA